MLAFYVLYVVLINYLCPLPIDTFSLVLIVKSINNSDTLHKTQTGAGITTCGGDWIRAGKRTMADFGKRVSRDGLPFIICGARM